MAVNPVSLCADLQAWHSAGLSFLYLPEVEALALLSAPANVRPELKAGRPPDAQKQPFAVSSSISQVDTCLSQKNNPIGQSSGVVSAGPDALAQGRGAAWAGEAANAPAGASGNAAAYPVGQSGQARPASVVLPEHWRALQPKLRPAPVIWTYLELGQDILVKGDPARSNALKELIASLGLTKGTSSFLPLVVPQGAQDGSEGWCFQSLLGQLGGRVVIVLGADSLAKSPYAESGLACFQEHIVQGRMVLCLPSFAELLASPDRFEATKVFLRLAFTKINIL